jgi:hypothetical protein
MIPIRLAVVAGLVAVAASQNSEIVEISKPRPPDTLSEISPRRPSDFRVRTLVAWAGRRTATFDRGCSGPCALRPLLYVIGVQSGGDVR